jgi:hypothetical protein
MIATIFSNPRVCRLSLGRICHEDREPQKYQRDKNSEDCRPGSTDFAFSVPVFAFLEIGLPKIA